MPLRQNEYFNNWTWFEVGADSSALDPSRPSYDGQITVTAARLLVSFSSVLEFLLQIHPDDLICANKSQKSAHLSLYCGSDPIISR